MMRRLRLNFYRAEDMMFIMRKREWAKEDEEFAKEQKRRAKEKKERLIKKNKARRLKKEMGATKGEQKAEFKEEPKTTLDQQDKELGEELSALLKCPVCSKKMTAPQEIYQCVDGHILCKDCRYKDEVKVRV